MSDPKWTKLPEFLLSVTESGLVVFVEDQGWAMHVIQAIYAPCSSAATVFVLYQERLNSALTWDTHCSVHCFKGHSVRNWWWIQTLTESKGAMWPPLPWKCPLEAITFTIIIIAQWVSFHTHPITEIVTMANFIIALSRWHILECHAKFSGNMNFGFLMELPHSHQTEM